MGAFRQQIVLFAAAVLCLVACGGERPSHAGLENLPTDRGVSLGGESSVSVADAAAVSLRSSAPDETAESYRDLLAERLRKIEARLERGGSHPSYQKVFELELQLLERKIDSLEFSYGNTRELRDAAHIRVRAFLIRFAPGLEWEADYAMQAGDWELVSALVQDVVDKMRRRLRLGGRASAGSGLDPHVPAPEEVTAAEKLAAETFLAIGRLAQDEVRIETAELNYCLARAYNPDVNVASEAAAAQIALLRALGRDAEAAAIESEVTAMLTR